MLEVKNLKIEIGLKTYVDNLSFSIGSGDKLAIIGEEGNGKTTLLRVLIGSAFYASFTGVIKISNHYGYFEQSINDNKSSVKNYLYEDESEFYVHLNEIYSCLKILHLDNSILEYDSIGLLSGGEKVKLQLLKILLQKPDILLLDEPTNDLDLTTLEWLEQFLIHLEIPIIFISHDEKFLGRVANQVLHIEQLKKKSDCNVTYYKGTYQSYIEKRTSQLLTQTQVARKERAERKKQLEVFTQIKNKVEHQQNTISRKDPHGAKMLKRKMKSIKVQERRMNQQELTELPDSEESILLKFSSFPFPKNKVILSFHQYPFQVGNRTYKIDFEVVGPKHIGIIGKNGIGKTTFLELLKKTMELRNDIVVAYMPQNYETILEMYETPLDYLVPSGDKNEVAVVRSYMGNLNFTREEMTGLINSLSGGSKAKLILLKLMLMKPTVLLLDEPTRNVSPLSNPVIRTFLKDFSGAIISVSHDRIYLEEVCDEVYELTESELKRRI